MVEYNFYEKKSTPLDSPRASAGPPSVFSSTPPSAQIEASVGLDDGNGVKYIGDKAALYKRTNLLQKKGKPGLFSRLLTSTINTLFGKGQCKSFSGR